MTIPPIPILFYSILYFLILNDPALFTTVRNELKVGFVLQPRVLHLWLSRWERFSRRKKRLIEVNSKWHHLKKLTFKGTLRKVFIRVYRLEIANFLRTFRHVVIFNPSLWSILFLVAPPPPPSLWTGPRRLAKEGNPLKCTVLREMPRFQNPECATRPSPPPTLLQSSGKFTDDFASRLGTTGRVFPLSFQAMRRWREAPANGDG